MSVVVGFALVVRFLRVVVVAFFLVVEVVAFFVEDLVLFGFGLSSTTSFIISGSIVATTGSSVFLLSKESSSLLVRVRRRFANLVTYFSRTLPVLLNSNSSFFFFPISVSFKQTEH